MVFLFKNTNGPITWGAVSNIIPTPITGLTATSTVAGQITLSWSGGIGQNVKYSYVLSSGTVQSVSGTASPVTLTLTSTNQVTTTVTVTATLLGGSTSAVSNSVTTQSLLVAALSTTPTVTSGSIASISSSNFATQGMSISVKYNLTSASSTFDTTLMESHGLRLFNYNYDVNNLNLFTFQLVSSTTSGGAAGTNFFVTPTLNSYPTGTYHVVITIGTGANPPVIIYVNNIAYTFGAGNGLKNNSASVITSASNFWGGKYLFSGPYTTINLGTTTGTNYPGTTTDLRFFDYPLSSTQVNAIYTNAA